MIQIFLLLLKYPFWKFRIFPYKIITVSAVMCLLVKLFSFFYFIIVLLKISQEVLLSISMCITTETNVHLTTGNKIINFAFVDSKIIVQLFKIIYVFLLFFLFNIKLLFANILNDPVHVRANPCIHSWPTFHTTSLWAKRNNARTVHIRL